MISDSVNIVENVASDLPAVIGALIILVIGWIAGHLLGKGERIVIDKVIAVLVIGDSVFGKCLTKYGIEAGQLGDITVQIIVYLVTTVAAVNILHLDYLSQFMKKVIGFVPHMIAFLVIIVVGVVLIYKFIKKTHLESDARKHQRTISGADIKWIF